MSTPEPTKELPVYKGQASLPEPTTAIPYSEPTLVHAPPRRSSGLLVAGMLTFAVLMIILGVIAGFALRPSGDSAAPDRPDAGNPVVPTTAPSPTAETESATQATQRFLAAVLDGNQQEIQNRLCGPLRSGGGGDNTGGLGLALIVAYEVGQEKVTGPAATVDVKVTLPFLDPIQFEVYLLLEQEGWKVCGGGPA